MLIGRTPLHQAVFMRELENIRAILEAGRDVNAVDHKGYTPIDLAYMAGVKKIVEELTAYKDSTSLKSKQYKF
jgi:ankyrin repeat protein